MPNVDYLSLEDVLEIHLDQICRYGGSAEVRDMGLLESALAMPQATFAGRSLHQDVYSMAAAYLFHIVQNHPFVDGNKRTGAVAAIIFLALNEVKVVASEEDFEALVWSAATGRTDKEAIAAFFRQHSHGDTK